MFLHNLSSKSWVLKTKIKFSDNDVSVGILMWGAAQKGMCFRVSSTRLCYCSHLSFSVKSNALWMQERRDIMDGV